MVNICIEVSMTLYKRISMCFALFAYSTKHMTNIQIIYIIHTAKKSKQTQAICNYSLAC